MIGPVSQIYSPLLHVRAHGIFSDLLKSVQMLKSEWGAESNGKLPNLFIPSKTATLVPECAVEDLDLSRTAALVPEFAVKDLPSGRTLMLMCVHIYIYIYIYIYRHIYVCDPFTYIHEIKCCHDLCPYPFIYQ